MSRYFSWDIKLELEDARRKLGLRGPLRSASVSKRGRHGRAITVRFEAPASVEMAATDVRQRLGTEVLFSTLIRKIRVADGRLLLSGGGWGHGVGMCQWGAIGMARRGASAGDVLLHYFPGAELTRLY
jgi:stage II sporulation protein D